MNPEQCIACFENTTNKVSCCKAPICNPCYLEWLKTKRQCMHCNEDQMDFDTWVNNHRVDTPIDTHAETMQYLELLLQSVQAQNPLFLFNNESQQTQNPFQFLLNNDESQQAQNPFQFLFNEDESPHVEVGYIFDENGVLNSSSIMIIQTLNYPIVVQNSSMQENLEDPALGG